MAHAHSTSTPAAAPVLDNVISLDAYRRRAQPSTELGEIRGIVDDMLAEIGSWRQKAKAAVVVDPLDVAERLCDESLQLLEGNRAVRARRAFEEVLKDCGVKRQPAAAPDNLVVAERAFAEALALLGEEPPRRDNLEIAREACSAVLARHGYRYNQRTGETEAL